MSDTHSQSHAHPPHLAHHFDTPQQQYDSAKLGMWVFLATEILMFGGLFCAYAIYRGNNPEVFQFAHKALDTNLGALNTIILLASSFTMAWGVRAAQLGQKGILVAMLLLTLAGGCGFMVIKSIEYKSKWEHGLFAGGIDIFKGHQVFHPQAPEEALEKRGHTVEFIEERAHGPSAGHGEHGAATHGEAAHDQAAHGEQTETGHGQQAHDHSEHAPAKDILAVEPEPEMMAVAWPPKPADHANAPVAPAGVPGTSAAYASVQQPKPLPQQLGVPEAGAGHNYPRFGELTEIEKKRTHIFFQIYFLMTGLHGIHVLIGMGAISVVTFIAFKGKFGPQWYTPVDLVGLYWHLVDLIWIFLFPLLYLIH